jgi:ribosomal protein S18 acetylase RimI-like enzyme
VSRLEVVPFTDAHLEDAAELLAARHRRHREVEPLLPERFEGAAAALGEVEEAWRKEGASGAAALRDGKLVGYLVGAPRETTLWGENTWIELAGYASTEPEEVRDLYAAAAARWVEEGRSRHYALVPAIPELVDPWYRVSFGQQHAHGIQRLPPEVASPPPRWLEIRRPRLDEIDELIAIDLALPAHQQLSPVFSDMAGPTDDESREEWVRTIEGDEEHVLVGYRDGTPLAAWSVVPAEVSSQHRGLGRPDHAAFLGFASTVPKARGTGIGIALTDACLEWAAERGYGSMVVDWRVTNLLASRFWPRRGFRTSFLRLYRSIP